MVGPSHTKELGARISLLAVLPCHEMSSSGPQRSVRRHSERSKRIPLCKLLQVTLSVRVEQEESGSGSKELN